MWVFKMVSSLLSPSCLPNQKFIEPPPPPPCFNRLDAVSTKLYAPYLIMCIQNFCSTMTASRHSRPLSTWRALILSSLWVVSNLKMIFFVVSLEMQQGKNAFQWTGFLYVKRSLLLCFSLFLSLLIVPCFKASQAVSFYAFNLLLYFFIRFQYAFILLLHYFHSL